MRLRSILVLIVLAGCASPVDKEPAVLDLLVQGGESGRWKLQQRLVDGEIEKDGRDLRLVIEVDGQIDINGHQTTYKLHHDRFLEFSYFYEDTHDYYIEILELSEDKFRYELQNCEFQTITETLVPDDD